jgi:2-oxoglutarate ferredoxin oxidoreductase subunit gamma
MRGGTAHCTVIIGDEPIGSPIVRQPSVCIVMNLPSLQKYCKLMQPGGLMIVNSSLVPEKCARTDVREVRIASSDIASELGDMRMSNMVLLGAFLRLKPILALQATQAALEAHSSGRAKRLLAENKKALQRGYDIAAESPA